MTLGSSQPMQPAPSVGSVVHQYDGDELLVATLRADADGAHDVRALGSPLATAPASSHQAPHWPMTGAATLRPDSPVVLTILLGFTLMCVVPSRRPSTTSVMPVYCWKPACERSLPPLCLRGRLSHVPNDSASGDAGQQSDARICPTMQHIPLRDLKRAATPPIEKGKALSDPIQHLTLKVERYDRMLSTDTPMRMSRGPPIAAKRDPTTLSRSRVGARKALFVKSGDV